MTDTQALAIRQAEPRDIDTLIAFNQAMAAEAEDLPLSSDTLRRGIDALFAEPALGFYLVASRAGEIVGQLMITYEWSDWRAAPFFWIQSVYVRPEARRGGVYRALHNEVERLAKERGACGIRLAVARDNTRAKSTYESVGLRRSVYDMYEVDFVFGGQHERAEHGK